MNIIEYIVNSLRDNPYMIGLLLAITVMALEDTSIIAAAVLAATGDISVTVALVSLFGGILTAEFICYFIGVFAHRSKWLKKIMVRQGMANAIKWLEKNLILAVIAARYIPGMRVAIYGAMGFSHLNIKIVFLLSLAVIFVWAGGLFFLVREFGMQYWGNFGGGGWLVVLGFAASLIFIYYTIQNKIRNVMERK